MHAKTRAWRSGSAAVRARAWLSPLGWANDGRDGLALMVGDGCYLLLSLIVCVGAWGLLRPCGPPRTTLIHSTCTRVMPAAHLLHSVSLDITYLLILWLLVAVLSRFPPEVSFPPEAVSRPNEVPISVRYL